MKNLSSKGSKLLGNQQCGLLLARRETILFESYGYARHTSHRFLSFSMAKGITSLLVGIAVSKGLLSLTQKVAEHVPKLAAGPYAHASVLDLLQMRPGVQFTETYAGGDELTRLNRAAAWGATSVVDVLNSYMPQDNGKVHRYSSADTEVLGRVLSSATGRSIEDMTQRWLWQPIGAEHTAHWIAARPDGHARCSAFFCATLQDWARLGRMLADEGTVDGKEVVPRAYLRAATSMSGRPPDMTAAQRSSPMHYGHHLHILPFTTPTFAFVGIGGQRLYVQPASGLVMVRTGVENIDEEAVWGPNLAGVWNEVLRHLGGDLTAE